MRKIICLLGAVALLLSMAACATEPAPTEPVTTAPVETTAAPETTEATVPLINTPQTLMDALASQFFVELADSIELEESAVVRGGEFNGNGYTLTAPAYVEDDKTTHTGLVVQSGFVRDVVIRGGYRALGNVNEHPLLGDVRLRNVWVEAETNAINFGYSKTEGILNAEDCTFYGWCSFSGFSSAYFENCTFGKGESKAKGNLRPYVDTVMIGCNFESKTTEDGKVVPYAILLRTNISGITITLEDCYADGVLITNENVYSLLEINMYDNVLRVHNTSN